MFAQTVPAQNRHENHDTERSCPQLVLSARARARVVSVSDRLSDVLPLPLSDVVASELAAVSEVQKESASALC